MKYELEVLNDSQIRIKKIVAEALWTSNQIFDDLTTLTRYISDFTELKTSLDIVHELLNSAPMNNWIDFE